MEIDEGTYKIQCVKAGGHTLSGYGGKTFAEGEEIDLLDASTPETLRCADWGIAENVCSDPSLEIAQLIASGDFVVTEKRRPVLSAQPHGRGAPQA